MQSSGEQNGTDKLSDMFDFVGNYIGECFLVWAVRECGKTIISAEKTNHLKKWNNLYNIQESKCVQLDLGANNIYIVMIKKNNMDYIKYIYLLYTVVWMEVST